MLPILIINSDGKRYIIIAIILFRVVMVCIVGEDSRMG